MAWSLVASTPASANSGTSPFNLTLGAACLVDDRVVVEASAFANGSNDAVTGITGTFCGTFTKDNETAQITNGSFNTKGSVWSAPVTSNGTPVLSISWTGSSGGGAASASAYRGLDTSVGSGAVDVSNTATGSSSSPSVTTGATSAANELVVGGFTCDENSITFTAAGGSTVRSSQVNAHGDTAIQDKDSGATGAQTSNGTTNVSSIWGMVAVVYKLSATTVIQGQSTRTSQRPIKKGPYAQKFMMSQRRSWFGVPTTLGTVNLSVTSTTTSTVTNQPGKVYSVTATGTPSLTKQVARAFSATATGTSSIIRQASRSLSVTATGTVSLLKRVARALSVTATGTATITAIKTAVVQLTATATATVTMLKQVGRPLAVTATGTSSLVKRVARAFAVTTTGAASMTAIKTAIVALTVTATATAIILKRVLRPLTLTVTGTPTLLKTAGHKLTVTATGTPTMSAIKTALVALVATATATVSFVKRPLKALTVTAVGTPSLFKGVRRVISVVVSGVASLVAALTGLPTPSRGRSAVASVTNARVVTASVTFAASAIASVNFLAQAAFAGVTEAFYHVGATTNALFAVAEAL